MSNQKTYNRYFKPIPGMELAVHLLTEAYACLRLPTDDEDPSSVGSRVKNFLDKGVCTHLDVYRIIKMFNVLGSGEQHALKKILCAGERGFKNYRQDLMEARDSLQREIDMLDQDEQVQQLTDLEPGELPF